MLGITIQVFGDVRVVRCVGRLTRETARRLEQALATQRDARIVVLDLAEVPSVDAGGLGTLVAARAWAHSAGIQLKLMNLAPRVEDLLEITHLKEAFTICSVAEMLELLCQAHAYEEEFASAAASA